MPEQSLEETFTQQVEVRVTATARFSSYNLSLLIHEHLRDAGLLRFDNPDDDHPNLATCGVIYRAGLEKAASRIANGIKIEIEMEEE